jgi:RNA polymerase sigma-70 factor (ECF subfamily)
VDTEAADRADHQVFEGLAREEYERVRRELTGYCYRMLGSLPDADDAVQETMIRAWRGMAGFEGRSAVRTWLHRIATNVCLTLLKERGRRALPMDLGPAIPARGADPGEPLPEYAWVLPAPDARVLPDSADPAQLAVSRESVRLAFVAALQHLPARQRAVLILRDVLSFSAAETADLLESSVASVNSALQRARAGVPGPEKPGPAAESEEIKQLLDDYVDAFEQYDMPRLTALLRQDAVQSMPPFPIWIQGSDEIVAWMLGTGAECRGSRLIPFRANGCPAYAQYRSDGRGGYTPWSITVMETEQGKVSALHSFVFPELFPAYGFPVSLETEPPRS